MQTKDPSPSVNIFPSRHSNPTAAQCEDGGEVDALLDWREAYMEAHGHTVNRTTGVDSVG